MALSMFCDVGEDRYEIEEFVRNLIRNSVSVSMMYGERDRLFDVFQITLICSHGECLLPLFSSTRGMQELALRLPTHVRNAAADTVFFLWFSLGAMRK